MHFPFLSTSGDVPVTPLYEYFPLGFKSLKTFLGAKGHEVEIINLASVLLEFPEISLPSLLSRLEPRVLGIDLHWLVHAQGSLALAEMYRKEMPGIPILFGGISATYFAKELIRYPFVSMVMRGYDTHLPMHELLVALKSGGEAALRRVPNLIWKDCKGEVVDNGLTYLPVSLENAVDWSDLPRQEGREMPGRELIMAQSAGCVRSCGWCGSSRNAFRRIYGAGKTIVRKSPDVMARELKTVAGDPSRNRTHIYLAGTYNETKPGLASLFQNVQSTSIRSVSYEQFRLPSDRFLAAMVRANSRTTITLSPESHDMRVSTLAGRGTYTPAEMEEWIERALDAGIHQVDIWYFIGMPEQDEGSVRDTVSYCGRLLHKFQGKRVVPFICPMLPFLDPGSVFFERPAENGYQLFYRSLEEHRRGMQNASLIHRMNYETRWLSRERIVFASYEAIGALTELKGEAGLLPAALALQQAEKVAEASALVKIVHRIENLLSAEERRRELEKIAPELRASNFEVFYGGVSNQAYPLNRPARGRWFDELLFSREELETFSSGGAS